MLPGNDITTWTRWATNRKQEGVFDASFLLAWPPSLPFPKQTGWLAQCASDWGFGFLCFRGFGFRVEGSRSVGI